MSDLTYALEGSGPPVLLLHGLGGDRTQALDLLPEAAGGVRIAPEMPGHGATDLAPDEPVGLDVFAAAIAALLDQLQRAGRISVGPLPVVGVSMGAALALRLQADRPDLVSRMVLVRPSYADVAPPPNMAVFELIGRLLLDHGVEDGRRRFLGSATYADLATASPAMAASALGQFGRHRAVERARVIRDMDQQVPLPDRAAYARIAVPTLVLGAPGDPVHDIGIARAIAEWIPGARFAALPRKDLDATAHRKALHRAAATELTPVLAG